jgi:hypothetical protein
MSELTHPFDELKHDIFQFDPDLARLKLALLKENFAYREFFQKFAGDPYIPFPVGDFQKFGLSGVRFSRGSPRYKEVLILIDPFKDVNLDPKTEESLLSKLFYSHGIMQIEFDKKLPFEGFASTTKTSLERRGIKPHERALLLDLRKKKKQLLREFGEFIDNVYRHKNYATIKKDSDFEFYKKLEPDISRFRKEAWTHLKVWKLRKKRMPFPKIAEGFDLSEDNARKSFYRAYELTQGRQYDPDKLKRKVWLVRKSELKKTCSTCDERESCMILCPEALGYVDQDILKHTKEKLFSDIDCLL